MSEPRHAGGCGYFYGIGNSVPGGHEILQFMQSHVGIMILFAIGHVLVEPVRGQESFGGFLAAGLGQVIGSLLPLRANRECVRNWQENKDKYLYIAQ